MRKQTLSGILGVLAALMIGGIVLALQGFNPFSTYGALLQYSLLSASGLSAMLSRAVPLVLTGLSASIAFGSGLNNLGQPGQLVIGALAATVVGLFVRLPAVALIPLCIAAAMVGGMLWSGLAAGLRRAFAMDEFIVTLMLNFIADYFTLWAITYPLFDPAALSPMTRPIRTYAWLSQVGGINASVLYMVAATVLCWLLMSKGVSGYEWRIMGQNRLFARIGGCRVDAHYVRVMLVTGALAGLAGGLMVMGGPHRFVKGLGANYAWDGVMIAVVANNSIPGTFLYGLLFSMLQQGAIGMELVTAVPSEFIDVLQAIIVLVVVAGRVSLNLMFDRIATRKKLRESLQ
ncbi:MAG: ABC transporter permease [Candidatus Cryosericum sp.]|nr:ABC transporter permease [Candidatus Cryosericum sp.]HPS69346.1 ABC transporter permease [Candidatus Cryosericum sp.]